VNNLTPGTPVPKPKPSPKKRPKPMARRSKTKRSPDSYAGTAPKEQRIRDPEHLERVRAMPCVVAPLVGLESSRKCGGWNLKQMECALNEAAHVTNRGWGGDDSEVIPLCPNHHRLLACSWHVAGRKRFEAMFGFSAAALARKLYDDTLALRGKATP